MRRLVVPGLVLLLVVVMVPSASAQRPGQSAAVLLEEPRPSPVFPAALVPFTLGSEICRDGGQPVVSLKVYNVLAQPVVTLHLRGRQAELLDERPLRCGAHVATWDGTIAEGTQVAPPGIYYVQLNVVGQRAATRRLIVPQP
jgi:hypothetical protein